MGQLRTRGWRCLSRMKDEMILLWDHSVTGLEKKELKRRKLRGERKKKRLEKRVGTKVNSGRGLISSSNAFKRPRARGKLEGDSWNSREAMLWWVIPCKQSPTPTAFSITKDTLNLRRSVVPIGSAYLRLSTRSSHITISSRPVEAHFVQSHVAHITSEWPEKKSNAGQVNSSRSFFRIWSSWHPSQLSVFDDSSPCLIPSYMISLRRSRGWDSSLKTSLGMEEFLETSRGGGIEAREREKLGGIEQRTSWDLNLHQERMFFTHGWVSSDDITSLLFQKNSSSWSSYMMSLRRLITAFNSLHDLRGWNIGQGEGRGDEATTRLDVWRGGPLTQKACLFFFSGVGYN